VLQVQALRLKVLYVSSSVGLGHVTRDYRLSRLLGWADITWLTAGRAAKYLEARGERLHELSWELRSLGDSIMNVIKGCRVTFSPIGLARLYLDLRRNSRAIAKRLNLEDFDLVIGDEPWELMMSGLKLPQKSVLITDITSLGSSVNYVSRRVNSWILKNFHRFTLRFNVGLWGDGEGFLRYGQIPTHESYPEPEEGDHVVINIGGTNAGLRLARQLEGYLTKVGIDVVTLGGENFVSDPTKVTANAKALVVLAGYGSLVEASIMRKRAVILKIDKHFEHRENARLFEGRKGYRVLNCSEATPEKVYSALLQVLRESPQPPQLRDASHDIASEVERLASQDSLT
jgi:hypothetical protein